MGRFLPLGFAWLLIGFVLWMGSASAMEAPAWTAPDLGRIAYVHQGDLWVKGLPDGPAKRVTRGARYGWPTWSPTGRWLLARQSDRLALLDAAGETPPDKAVRPWRAAAWAPERDRIAYLDAQGQLGIMDADGSHNTRLPLPAGDVGNPVWSADGRTIAITIRRIARPPQETSYVGLWLVPVAGGPPIERYAIRGPGPQCLDLAGWTPDGRYLLAWPYPICSGSLAADGLPLIAVPTAGGESRQLVDTMLLHPDFLAVSRTGTVALVAGVGRDTAARKRIGVVNPAGAPLRYITPEGEAAISPAWSPDGAQLAYVTMPAVGMVGGEPFRQALLARRIWLKPVAGVGGRRLTVTEGAREEYPRWLADGRHVLFAQVDALDRASVWVGDSRGGSPVRVADLDLPGGSWAGYYGWINWSESVADWPGPAAT